MISAHCHINHFPISLIPWDCRHFTFYLPIWVTMETGGRENPQIAVVNQTEANNRLPHVAGKQDSSLREVLCCCPPMNKTKTALWIHQFTSELCVSLHFHPTYCPKDSVLLVKSQFFPSAVWKRCPVPLVSFIRHPIYLNKPAKL